MTDAFFASFSVIAGCVHVMRARTPGTPAGDADEEHEDNTYNLPEGRPIRRAFKRFAKRQLKKILASVPEIGAPLPARFPSLTDWNDPMASAMTPLVSLYWDEAGQTTRARLGLDPDQWEVHDPHLHQVIQQQAFRFCESTNQTTDKELGEALDQLRQEFTEGLVDAGETIPELTRRVQSVFSRLSRERAEMIARTEAARAVHAASLISAKESGVVEGKKWLLSGDACEYCHKVAAKFPGGTGLDTEFNNDGKGTDYSSVQMPPLHPNCRCSVTYVLTDEYEKLLAEHGPPEPEKFDYDGGSLGPEPKKRKIAKPAAAPKPPPAAPKPKPVRLPVPVDVSLPIEERIRKADGVQRKLRKLWRIGSGIEDAKEKQQKSKDAMIAYTVENSQALTNIHGPEMKRLLELEKKHALNCDRVNELRSKVGERVSKVFDIPAGRREKWKHADGAGSWTASDPNYATRQKAQDWLESKVVTGGTGNPIEVTWNIVPGTRPFANQADKSITVDSKESQALMIHEMGHHVEFKSPGAEKAAQEFLAYRVKGETPQKLKDLFPTYNFKDNEYGRKDEFGKAFSNDASDAWYVGKHYSFGSTEIISMGLQKLFEDPLTFADNDPEYCAFIIGILDGTLRKP